MDVIVFNGAWEPSVRLLQSVRLTSGVFFICLEDITKGFCAGKADNDPGLFEIPQLILQIKHMWANDDRLH